MQPAPTVEALLAEREWIERIARRLARDAATADDVAQEAWRRGLAGAPVRLTSPRGWIRTLVTSAARDLHRGESRRAARERAASRDERTPSADVVVARAEAHRLVLDEVLALDAPSREVVLLRFFEGLAPAEIARRRGEPATTVRSRLHRALGVLRARLSARGGGPAQWAALFAAPRTAARLDGAALAKGALLVTTKTKVALGAAALVLLALLFCKSEGVAPAPAPKAESDVASAAPRKRLAADPKSPEQPAPAATTTATAAAAAPAASGPTRLTLRMLAPRAPDPPPDMPGKRTVDASGQVVKIDSEPSDGGIQLGGGRGGMAVVGWEKWKPLPERGTVTLKGRVLDARGEPLAGAEVLRVDPEAGGADGDVVDFRHITQLGTTGRDGSFTLERQPARPYRLAANWRNAMSRPRGLLFAGLVAVEPRDGATLSGIELRLPLNASDFGAVTGRVTDEDGAPLRAEVSVGLVSVRSGGDGRYRLEGVPVGSQRVEAEDFATRPAARTVTVSATADAAADFVLAAASTGPHEISGVVRDEDGAPVAGLEMWCGGTIDVSRHGVTAADGSFRFPRLPAPAEGLAYTVSLMPDYENPAVMPASVRDVVPPKAGLAVVAQRTVRLRILVRDAETAAVLPLFNGSLERRVVEDGEEKLVPFRTATLYEEDGAWDVWVPRGETVLFLEAPDHRPFHAAVDVPASKGEFEVVVEMQR